MTTYIYIYIHSPIQQTSVASGSVTMTESSSQRKTGASAAEGIYIRGKTIQLGCMYTDALFDNEHSSLYNYLVCLPENNNYNGHNSDSKAQCKEHTQYSCRNCT